MGRGQINKTKSHPVARKYPSEVVKEVWRELLLSRALGYHKTHSEENIAVAEKVGLTAIEVTHIRLYYSPIGCYDQLAE